MAPRIEFTRVERRSLNYEWNGSDDRGAPLPAGVYIVRYTAPGSSTSQRIARVR